MLVAFNTVPSLFPCNEYHTILDLRFRFACIELNVS